MLRINAERCQQRWSRERFTYSDQAGAAERFRRAPPELGIFDWAEPLSEECGRHPTAVRELECRENTERVIAKCVGDDSSAVDHDQVGLTDGVQERADVARVAAAKRGLEADRGLEEARPSQP